MKSRSFSSILSISLPDNEEHEFPVTVEVDASGDREEHEVISVSSEVDTRSLDGTLLYRQGEEIPREVWRHAEDRFMEEWDGERESRRVETLAAKYGVDV